MKLTSISLKRGADGALKSALASLVGLLVTGPAWAVPIMMPTDSGPIVIDSNNFASTVVDSSLSATAATFGPGAAFNSGPLTTAQAIPFVVGSDTTQGVSLGQGPQGGVADFIVPAFGLASIVNGAGADFAIWEAGAPAEDFLLAVSTDGGVTFSADMTYSTTVTNPLATTPPYNINIGYVNLDDFGIAAGGAVDAIRVAGLFTGIGGSGPDLLALAALNAGPPTGNVPEPASLGLLGIGLAGLGFAARRRRKD